MKTPAALLMVFVALLAAMLLRCLPWLMEKRQ